MLLDLSLRLNPFRIPNAAVEEEAGVPLTANAPVGEATGTSSGTFTFTAPDDGGSEITAWEFEHWIGDGARTTLNDPESPIALTEIPTSEDGTAVSARVRYRNEIGWGSWSPVGSFTTEATVPAIPAWASIDLIGIQDDAEDNAVVFWLWDRIILDPSNIDEDFPSADTGFVGDFLGTHSGMTTYTQLPHALDDKFEIATVPTPHLRKIAGQSLSGLSGDHVIPIRADNGVGGVVDYDFTITINAALAPLKSLAPGGLLVGMALPNDFVAGNDDFPGAMIAYHCDTYCLAGLDKMTSTITSNGSGVVTGYNLAGGNAIRTAADGLGMAYATYHTIFWHNGIRPDFILSSDAVQNQDTTFEAWLDYISANNAGWDGLRAIVAANEISDNAQTDYIRRSVWTQEREADVGWTLPLDCAWLPQLDYLASVADPSTNMIVQDYNIEFSTINWGYGAAAESGFESQNFQEGRWWSFIHQVKEVLQEITDNPGTWPDARIDEIGFQYHVAAGKVINLEDLKWKLWECNLLEMDVSITEFNQDESGVEALGYTVGTEAFTDYCRNYAAVAVDGFFRYADSVPAFDFWTDVDVLGSGQVSAWLSEGQPTHLARAVGHVFQNMPTKDAKRAARMIFNRGSGVMPPRSFTGTVASLTSGGVRGTTIRYPFSQFKRRVSGTFGPMSQAEWEMELFFQRSGSNANISGGRMWFMEDASNNEIFAVGWNGSGQICMRHNGGAWTVIGTVANGSYAKLQLKYTGTSIIAALSHRTSAGVITNASGVVTHSATLDTDCDEFGVTDATNNCTFVYHGYYDTTDISADNATLQARSALTSNFGGVMTKAEIEAFGA